ncbi:MAG: hypothetical protein GY711_11405 [bacterium]|nr:hypothetical protein [bacterium]
MAFTQEQLDALEAAIAEGAQEVRYQDKSVRYNSLAEMRRLRAEMKRELGQAAKGPRNAVPRHTKGL